MNNKFIQPPIKLNYFNCQKGSLHDGQVLNYVCIEKSCPSKGLLCSVCKNDHSNHNVIPLKYLLNALKGYQNGHLSSQSFQSQIQELQKLKNSFLYQLKLVVQKFAQKIQQIEQKIVELFKNKKIELMKQIEMSMKFNDIIESTIKNEFEDQQSFEKDFQTLASLIENNKKSQNGKNIDNLSFSINLKKVIQDYEINYKLFSQKLNSFLEDSQIRLNKLLETTTISIQEPPKLSVPIQPIIQNQQKISYKFSSTLKAVNIIISSDNLTAECNSTTTERFALIDGTVEKKNSCIKFKIEKLKNWIGIGLGIKNNIIGRSYQFMYNTPGHGSFLLSSNGYSWSHSNVSNNLVLANFHFYEGNIVKIQVNQYELIFTNQTLQNKIFKLPIKLTQNQWKQTCFCVNLTSPGDKVSII